MALIDIQMPKLGLTMTEGMIAEWLVTPGAAFDTGAALVIVETDKIASEIEAPASGTMVEHLFAAGDSAPVGVAIARVNLTASQNKPPSPKPKPVEEEWQPEVVAARPGVPSGSGASRQAADADRIVATPYARKLAKEDGVDLRLLAGSGPGGRIKAVDLPKPAAAEFPAPRRASNQPGLSAIIACRVNVESLLAILENLRPRPGIDGFRMVHAVALAVTRVLAEGFNAARAIDLGICEGILGGKKWTSLTAESTFSLSGIALAMANGDTRESDEQALSILIADLSEQRVLFAGWTGAAAETITLGMGAVEMRFMLDTAGEPMASRWTTLTLTSLVTPNGPEPAAILTRICAYLESPLLLLS